MEFKPFKKISKLSDLQMTITQKVHGTNAHIMVFEYTSTNGESHEPRLGIKAASRNRWLYPEDDNYGFAKWVEDNKDELIEKLGLGRHDGEWAGSGINSGEGFLNGEKVFVLFDWWRYQNVELPKGCVLVPVLYHGSVDMQQVKYCMDDLLHNGSKLVLGFDRPEGVVVQIAGVRYKKTFKAEESSWSGKDPNKVKIKKGYIDYSHLCQPLRLEKLLSKDERYTKDYPKTLALIVKDYIQDLIDEGQIAGDDDQIKAIRKYASGQIFKFIKTLIEE